MFQKEIDKAEGPSGDLKLKRWFKAVSFKVPVSESFVAWSFS